MTIIQHRFGKGFRNFICINDKPFHWRIHSNRVDWKHSGIITNPCPYFNDGLASLQLKLEHGWVLNTTHTMARQSSETEPTGIIGFELVANRWCLNDILIWQNIWDSSYFTKVDSETCVPTGPIQWEEALLCNAFSLSEPIPKNPDYLVQIRNLDAWWGSDTSPILTHQIYVNFSLNHHSCLLFISVFLKTNWIGMAPVLPTLCWCPRHDKLLNQRHWGRRHCGVIFKSILGMEIT